MASVPTESPTEPDVHFSGRYAEVNYKSAFSMEAVGKDLVKASLEENDPDGNDGSTEDEDENYYLRASALRASQRQNLTSSYVPKPPPQATTSLYFTKSFETLPTPAKTTETIPPPPEVDGSTTEEEEPTRMNLFGEPQPLNQARVETALRQSILASLDDEVERIESDCCNCRKQHWGLVPEVQSSRLSTLSLGAPSEEDNIRSLLMSYCEAQASADYLERRKALNERKEMEREREQLRQERIKILEEQKRYDEEAKRLQQLKEAELKRLELLKEKTKPKTPPKPKLELNKPVDILTVKPKEEKEAEPPKSSPFAGLINTTTSTLPTTPDKKAAPAAIPDAPSKTPPSKPTTVAAGLSASVFPSVAAEKSYNEIMTNYETLKTHADSLIHATTNEHKTLRQSIKKAIHVPISQISASQAQIIAKADALKAVLQQQGDLAIQTYVRIIVANKFVDQGSSQCHVHPSSSFPIACVMIMLVKEFPELHDLYMALLFRHCPYLAPKFPAKDKNQTAEEFRLSAGYKKGPDDKLESESQFWERMRGYASLYAAYCSIDYLGEDKPMYYNDLWTVVARLLNSKVRKVSGHVLVALLQNGGYTLNKRFPHQFPKLVTYIEKSIIPVIPEGIPTVKSLRSLTLQAQLQQLVRESKKEVKVPEGFNIQ